MARLVLLRLPYPVRAFTLALPVRGVHRCDLDGKIFSTAILICVLLESGRTKNVYTLSSSNP